MYICMSQYGVGQDHIRVSADNRRIYIKIHFGTTKLVEDALDVGMTVDEASSLYASLGQALQEVDRAVQEAGHQDTPQGYA